MAASLGLRFVSVPGRLPVLVCRGLPLLPILMAVGLYGSWPPVLLPLTASLPPLAALNIFSAGDKSLTGRIVGDLGGLSNFGFARGAGLVAAPESGLTLGLGLALGLGITLALGLGFALALGLGFTLALGFATFGIFDSFISRTILFNAGPSLAAFALSMLRCTAGGSVPQFAAIYFPAAT